MGDAPVRLLVDARPVSHPTARQRGIGRYVTGLLGGLVEIGAPVTALCFDDEEAEILQAAVPGLELAPMGPETVRRHCRPGTWFVATQLMFHPVSLDPVPSIVTEARLPVAAIMYDVIQARYPERYFTHPIWSAQARLRAALARTLDALLAISTFAADTSAEVLRYPRERIVTIGAGIGPQFRPSRDDPWPVLQRVVRNDGRGLVVAVTGTDERKNTAGLLRAWALLPASLRERHHLVIAAAYDDATHRRWQQWASQAGVAHEVTFTGALTDDELVALHQVATLAVMPSIEEGFGLPVVEAAACGCPVICSQVTSLPEVLDEPDAWFDPHQPAAIAAAIEWALTDDEHRAHLRAAGARAVERWTWPAAARAVLGALGELGPRWPRALRSPRARVALIGPFEGSRSGIADYDVAVLSALRRHRAVPEVHVLVDGSGTPEPTHPDVGRFPARALGPYVKPWSYDHLVAVLGTSHHHVAGAQLALRHRCHLWLHEPSLVGAELGLAHLSGSKRWATDYVQARLAASEPPERAALVTPDELLVPGRYHELGLSLLGEHLQRARSVIVSSDLAATIVRSIDPRGAPVLVLPLAHPAVWQPRAAPAGREVVCLGWLGPNKAADVLVRAMRRLRHLPDVSLTFVGQPVGDIADRVRRAARTVGVEHLVAITGYVTSAELDSWIGRARAAVQLRAPERGEQSDAVARLLAAGVPTLTNMTSLQPFSEGLRHVPLDPVAIACALEPLLTDDTAWHAASDDARARASAWTFDDVAAALLDWLDRADGLAPGTVDYVGPASAWGRER